MHVCSEPDQYLLSTVVVIDRWRLCCLEHGRDVTTVLRLNCYSPNLLKISVVFDSDLCMSELGRGRLSGDLGCGLPQVVALVRPGMALVLKLSCDGIVLASAHPE